MKVKEDIYFFHLHEIMEYMTATYKSKYQTSINQSITHNTNTTPVLYS